MNPNTILDFIRSIFDFLQTLVPHDVLSDELEESGRRRAKAEKRLADDAKFGPDNG